METGNKIIRGNCVDVIDQFEDNSIDVCLTDPPYGINFQSGLWSPTGVQKSKILNDESPYIEWIKPLFSKMKDGGRLLCFYRWDVQNEFLNEIVDAGFTVKSQIVWDKGIHGMGDLKGEFAPQHELIIYATKGRYEFKGKRPTTMLKVNRVSADKLIHPNEKPVELLQKLLMSVSSKNELVFDPFGGSFSTYLAATSLGRKCVTCELSDEKDIELYYYCPKVDKKERNMGMEDFPDIDRERRGNNQAVRYCSDCNKTFNGINDHSNCIGKIGYRQAAPLKNNHPTVKPISLLFKILNLFKTPNPQVCVDTFAGSGSIPIAATLLGFEVIACDLDEGFVEIANARLDYAIKNKEKLNAKYTEVINKILPKQEHTKHDFF